MDACLFALSFWLAYVLRTNPDVIRWFQLHTVDPADKSEFVWLYLLLIPASPMILEANGFYNRALVSPRLTTAWLLFKSCVFATLGMTLVLFLFHIYVARFVIIWFAGISFVLVFLKEEALLWLWRSRLSQAKYRRHFLLVGAGGESSRLRPELEYFAKSGIDVVAEIDLNKLSVAKLVETLHEHSINGVILSANKSHFEQVEGAIRACELEGVEVWLVADFFKLHISRTSLDDMHGRPVLVFRSAPDESWQSIIKSLMDFVGALVGIALSSVIMIPAAIAIKLTSPGPILFRQQRSGLNGRPFTILKFRTMVTNAEQFKHELESMNEMSGPVFKVTNDPRITRLGKILRKYSIDELPQLFNVLRGDMSLVGPRPLPVDEVKRFNDMAHRRRLSVKPGLTCLWQISGRNNVKDFKDWVRLDLEYIDNWSLWLDFKILCQTVPVVLMGSGAK
jgi:exopolysaccharide biosynthesis polyprenyl glycosylphosphotransferase